MPRHRRLVAPLLLALVASLCSFVVSVQPVAAAAKNDKPKKGGGGIPAPTPNGSSLYYVGVTSAGPAGDGYWVVSDGGIVQARSEAADDPVPPWYGDLAQTAVTNIVAIAGNPNGGGYWLAGRDGVVYQFGNATYLGNAPASNIVGIVATPSGGGYWLVGADGGVFAFNAPFFGSLGGQGYTDVVGMAATPSGQGYWLVRSNGAIYSYGDAVYHGGSPNGVNNVTGMARTADGGGYWLVGADGGIFSYGNASFYGNGLGICCGFTYSAIVAKRNLHDGYRITSKYSTDFPSFEPNKSPIGTVEENSYNQVVGCAVDPNTTTTAITVQIVVDGVQRYSQATSTYDSACSYSGISGNHGFNWNIGTQAPDLLNAQPHDVKVYAVDTGTPAPQLPSQLLNDTTWTAPNLDPVGAVERSGSQITGWVHDPNDANQRLTVNIYLDNAQTPTATVTANVSRPNNNPPASDGFQWTVPTQYLDGKDHPVKVEALDYPSNTPVRITDTTMSFLELDDAWTLANGSTWNSNAWNTSANDPTARIVDVQGNQGRLYVAGPLKDAQAKQVITSNNAAVDSEALLSYQFVDPGDVAKLKVALRGSDSLTGVWMSDGYQAEIRSYSNVVKIYRVAGGTRTDLGGGFTYTPGTTWQSMRMRVTGTNPTIIRVKMWPKGTTEPDTWTTTVTDNTPMTTAGVFHVSLTNSGGTTARTVMVDDLGYTRLKTAINEGNPSSAPSNSFSIYLNGGSGTNFTALGQQEGQRVLNPTCDPAPTPCTPPPAPYNPLVILDFGAQKNDLTQTQEVGGAYIARQQIIDGSVAFINGYYSTNPGHELVFGVGTNNSNSTTCGSPNANEDCARKKGTDWAAVVNSVWNAVKTAHPNATVVGAQDFEEGEGFGGAAPDGPRNAKGWVVGFERGAQGMSYINFGAADGCRSATYPYGVSQPCPTGQHPLSKKNYWMEDDYWFLSRGVPSSGGVLPEIYNLSGNGKSDDWRNVSWYGYDSHDYRNIMAPDGRIDFLGVMTQRTACVQTQYRTCTRGQDDRLPVDAWANFRQELDAQEPCTQPCPVEFPTKGESLGFTSDIKWES